MSRPRNSERVEPIYPDRTKVCPACGAEKPWRAFYPRTRHADGTVAGVRAKCKLCESGVAQARWQAKVANPDREDELAARRAYHADRMMTDAEYAERFRRIARENRRLRYRNDPEFRAAVIARSVAFNKSERGRALERQRRARARKARLQETSMRLPLAPWQEWLLEQRPRFADASAMADWLGVDESGLRRWLDGTTGVGLDTADACLLRVGRPHLLLLLWPELYPDEDGEEEALA